MRKHEWYYDRTISDHICADCKCATDFCDQAAERADMEALGVW